MGRVTWQLRKRCNCVFDTMGGVSNRVATRNQQLAEALELEPELAPFLPTLLADIRVLGSWPERIVPLLRSAGIGPGAEVLEPGCGKGGVSVALASELGCRVRGVDLCEDFVASARAYAAERGVAKLCRFETGDARAVLEGPERFDALVFAAVGGVFGSIGETMGLLRRPVRRGGWLVIDDGYLLADDRPRPPGYGYCLGREETRAMLTTHGDAIEQEVIVPTAELADYNAENNRCIRRRVAELTASHPQHAALFADFMAAQIEECRYIEENTVAAIWLLRRGARA
jgi:ubiquinone/menaquinone biosynthesis C-methylase UbiE